MKVRMDFISVMSETRRAPRLDSTFDWRLAQAEPFVRSSVVPIRQCAESRNAGRTADETGLSTPAVAMDCFLSGGTRGLQLSGSLQFAFPPIIWPRMRSPLLVPNKSYSNLVLVLVLLFDLCRPARRRGERAAAGDQGCDRLLPDLRLGMGNSGNGPHPRRTEIVRRKQRRDSSLCPNPERRSRSFPRLG